MSDHCSGAILHCVASNFSPGSSPDDNKARAHENVNLFKDVISRGIAGGCKGVVITSSMAAVRGRKQPTARGYYDNTDWNTVAKLNGSFGDSYQWSKSASERAAVELCREAGIPWVSLCPSMIFGPPIGNGGYSVAMVRDWSRGRGMCESRLCVDVRDLAQVHVRAAEMLRDGWEGGRYIVSHEARLPAEEVRNALISGGASKNEVYVDENFEPEVPVGCKEVDAADLLLTTFGMKLRPEAETYSDMSAHLLTKTMT